MNCVVHRDVLLSEYCYIKVSGAEIVSYTGTDRRIVWRTGTFPHRNAATSRFAPPELCHAQGQNANAATLSLYAISQPFRGQGVRFEHLLRRAFKQHFAAFFAASRAHFDDPIARRN